MAVPRGNMHVTSWTAATAGQASAGLGGRFREFQSLYHCARYEAASLRQSSYRAGAPPPAGDFDAEEALSFETSKGVKVVNTFEAMKIRDPLLRGVYAFGFEKPSAIQQRAILPITQGQHLRMVHCMQVHVRGQYCGCRSAASTTYRT